MSNRSRPLLVVLAVLALVLGLSGTALASPHDGAHGVWIVTLHDGHDASAEAHLVARSHGGEARFVYEHVLNGFSFHGSERAAANLSRDPRVRTVVADQPVEAAETLPTGVDRIQADDEDSTGAGINVAVLDTGVDLDHEDLDIDATLGENCIDPDAAPEDGHGHGTHVSGTVAAASNGLGVIGVAPNVTIVPVKVLSDSGSGTWESVICGVDHVTGLNTDGDGNFSQYQIHVANMSLGGSGEEGACDDGGLRQAICESVNGAQVVYSVAAGNDSKDASGFVPAAYPEVITVSALADFDGASGGEGGCFIFAGMGKQCDDDFAKFSNHGSIIDVIAPGVLINSTLADDEYGEKSGTSMAAPHVAGVAALVRAADSDLSPSDVEALLRDTGECPDGQPNANTGDCTGQGQWENDPDGIAEPLVNAPGAVAAAPGYTSDDGGTATNSPPTASFTSTCTDLSCDFDGTGSSDSDGSISSYDWDLGDGNTATGETVSHTYDQDGTYTVTLTVTDDDGATDSDSETVSVSDPSSDGSIDVTGVDTDLTTEGEQGTLSPGTTTIEVYGSGFTADTAVTFENGRGPTPEGMTLGVNLDGTVLTVDVTVRSGGPSDWWDLVVTNPDGASAILASAVYVER